MSKIIVAFSKRENAANIRNILVQSGLEVSAVCSTGAKALQFAQMWSEGIIICPRRMQDMYYLQLRECLPEAFDMLLIDRTDQSDDVLPEGVIGLASPIRICDLVNTVEMLIASQEAKTRKRKKKRVSGQKRSDKERKVIEEAKSLLMERNHMTEPEAHRYIQKLSMESGNSMTETAEMILTLMNE